VCSSFHHHGRIQEIVEERGCHIIYLPPYSPDLNPIKKGFGVLKASLRRYAQLSGGEDDGDAIDTYAKFIFTPELMRSLFRGASYID
jgi:transposase